ncbi:MAG TPA: hypothetical protein VK874_17065 [Gaiellaceae bacterium]|nr:hypothetical protein [Gaiellaceae bacterium]
MDQQHEFGSGLRKHLGFEFLEPVEVLLPSSSVSRQEEEPPVDPVEAELERRLSYLAAAEEAFVDRERELDAREQALAQLEEELAAREEELVGDLREAGLNARQLLRRRAEQHADGLWRTFEEAMRADAPDGGPDHAIRIAAARALLAEAYDQQGGGAELEDELARLRARRTAAAGP